MFFCPVCGNLCLLGECFENGQNMLFCQACTFRHLIERPIKNRENFVAKVADDILGGKENWANVDQTSISCPKCEHGRAFYMQIQIRSADEPSTLFYKCVECGHDWRD